MTWTVSRRIATGFAIVLGLVVVLGGVGVLALRNATAAHEDARRAVREVMIPALEAETEVREATIAYERFLLRPEDRFARGRDSAVAVSRALLERLGDESTGEARMAWEGALTLLDRWDEASRASMRAAGAGDTEEALRVWEARVLPLRAALRDEVARGLELTEARTAAVVEAASASSERMRRLLLVTVVVAIVAGVGAAFLLDRAVSGPLRETTGVLASNAAEILAASTQQASSATQTSAAVAETSATVDEVAQTSEQAAERARTVADSARRAAETGKAGRRAVDETVAAMTGVREEVQSIADSILVLAEQAQAIGDVISTVDDIADQTHLLALNAAVEAARAGEHGRGFAVVAGEVRSLAEQSKRATVQVRQILGEIQRATSAAVMTTERGTHQAGTAAEQVTEAGETIRALADAVTEAAQAASQIVASAGQHAVGMTQIREAMGSIQEATQQNLSSTRQAEQAAHDLNRLGKRLLALVGGDGRGPAPEPYLP